MNYENIGAAVEFYKRRGYVYVPDAPWTVGRDAYYATKPEGATDVKVIPEDRFFVASGEQSFIQMMLDGQQLKRAVCVTPCFRVERRDHWHLPYFMKVELINAHDVDEGHLVHMVHDAAMFYEERLRAVQGSVRVIQTSDPMGSPEVSYDIVEKETRIELGSYGIRGIKRPDGSFMKWIYGTGCAEPRLSSTMSRTLQLFVDKGR